MCAIQTKNGILLTLQLSFPNAFLAGLISRHDELNEERKAGCLKITQKISFCKFTLNSSSTFLCHFWRENSNIYNKKKIEFSRENSNAIFLLIFYHCFKGSFLRIGNLFNSKNGKEEMIIISTSVVLTY